MNTFIVFLLLTGIVIVLFYKPDKFENFVTKFNGNVHIRGKAEILTDSNQKIKCDKLCIKDSATGKVSCIDPEKLFYLINNKDHRLKMICLGNTCINQNHIDILKGKNTFKIANYKNNQCLANIGRKSPIYNTHDDDDDCRHDLVRNVVAYRPCKHGINFHFEDGANVSGSGGGSGRIFRNTNIPKSHSIENKDIRGGSKYSRDSDSDKGISM